MCNEYITIFTLIYKCLPFVFCMMFSNVFLLIRGAQITDNQAKDALLEFVAQHCCYGKGAAESMDIKDMHHSNAYHVRTFGFYQD